MQEHTNANGREHSEISRRRFLELTGVAGGAAALGGGDAAALSAPDWRSNPDAYFVGPADAKPSAPARGAMYFETDTGDQRYYDGSGWRTFGRSSAARRIVDVVEAGADPTGAEPIDGVLNESYTGSEIFYFPSGTYTMKRPFEVMGEERVGFVGRPDATLRAAPDFEWSHMLIEAGDPSDPVGEVYVRDLTLDISSATPDVGGVEAHFSRRLEIDNVTVTEGVGKWMAGLLLTACEEDAVGRVTADLSAGAARVSNADDYSAQPIGVLIEDEHAGTITLRDCVVGKFPNNGVYGSQGSGRVEIVGGHYFDSDVSNIRVGSNCAVRGSTVTVDDVVDADLNTVGIRVLGEAGNTLVENVRVRTTETNGHAVMIASGGPVAFRDSRIERSGSSSGYSVSVTGPDDAAGRVTLDNVTVTDDTDGADTEYSMRFGRPRVTLRGSTLEDRGSGTSGVLVQSGARDAVIADSTVDVPNYPLSLRAPDVTLRANEFARGNVVPLPTEGDAVVVGNAFDNEGLMVRETAGELTLDGNVGVTMHNAGLSDPRDGGGRSYRFPHGLDETPDDASEVVVQPATADAAGAHHVAVDGDDIVVSYAEATPSGSGNLRWRFSARYRT